MKTTPIPVKFDRQGHSCNFYGGLGPTVKKYSKRAYSSPGFGIGTFSVLFLFSFRLLIFALLFSMFFFLLSWVSLVVGFMSSDTFPNTSRHARNTCGNSPKSVHFVFPHVLFFFVLCFRSAPFFLGFSVLVAFLIAARRVENSQETQGNNCAATATTCPATPTAQDRQQKSSESESRIMEHSTSR